MLVTGERNLPAIAVISRLETEDPRVVVLFPAGGGGREPGEEVLVPGLGSDAGGDGGSPAEPDEVVLHLVKQTDGPVLHRPALAGPVLAAGLAVQGVAHHRAASDTGGQSKPGALTQLLLWPPGLPPPDGALELPPPQARRDTASSGGSTGLLVPTVALLPSLHQAVTTLAAAPPAGQALALPRHHLRHTAGRAGGDPLVVGVDPTAAVATHQEPPPALPVLRVVSSPETVVDLVCEVENPHAERDPRHLPGPHGYEETVEVEHLRAVLAGHVGPGLTDAGLGHVVCPPRETQHLPWEHPAGEEDGETVAVQLVLGESLEVALWGHGAGVGVQDVVVRCFGLDDPQPRHVDPQTVGPAVLVVVLPLHEGVQLPHVVEHLQDAPLDGALSHLLVESLVSDQEKTTTPTVSSLAAAPPLLDQPPPQLQLLPPVTPSPSPVLSVSSDLSPTLDGAPGRFCLSVGLS